jgi:hypothetical protein
MKFRIAILAIVALCLIEPSLNADSAKKSQHEFPVDQNMNQFLEEKRIYLLAVKMQLEKKLKMMPQ